MSLALLFATWPQNLAAYQDAQAPTQPPAQAAQAPAYAQQTPEQLQQLVAPIALYPDSLVAQILAASTFPSKSSRPTDGCKAHLDLKGDALGQAVDQQPWTPASRRSLHFLRPWKYGQEPLLDVISGRCLLQPGTRCEDAVQVMRQKRKMPAILKARRSRP